MLAVDSFRGPYNTLAGAHAVVSPPARPQISPERVVFRNAGELLVQNIEKDYTNIKKLTRASIVVLAVGFLALSILGFYTGNLGAAVGGLVAVLLHICMFTRSGVQRSPVRDPAVGVGVLEHQRRVNIGLFFLGIILAGLLAYSIVNLIHAARVASPSNLALLITRTSILGLSSVFIVTGCAMRSVAYHKHVRLLIGE